MITKLKRRAVALAFALTIVGQVSITPAFATPAFVESWRSDNGPSAPAGNSGNVPPPFRDNEITVAPTTESVEEATTSETANPTTAQRSAVPRENPTETEELQKPYVAVPRNSEVEEGPIEEEDAGQDEPTEPVAVEKPVPLSSGQATTKPQRGETKAPQSSVTGQPANPESETAAAAPNDTEKYEPAPHAPEPLRGTAAEPTQTSVDAAKQGDPHSYRNTSYTGNLSPTVAITSLALLGLALIGGVVFTIGSNLTFRKD